MKKQILDVPYVIDITRIYQSKKNPLRFYPTLSFEDGREQIGLDEEMSFELFNYKKAGENNHFIIYDKKKTK